MITMNEADRVRAALAEAGYPDASVRMTACDCPELCPGGECVAVGMTGIPLDVMWTALLIAALPGTTVACWPCWSQELEDRCTHDAWTEHRPVLRRGA